MFLQRALVSFTLGPLALIVAYLGGWFYFVPVTALLLIATVEYAQLMKQLELPVKPWLLVTAVFLIHVTAQWLPPQYLPATFAFSLGLALATSLFFYEQQHNRTVMLTWMAASVGVTLFGWMGSHFFQLRNLSDMAWQWTILALLSTWSADSAAYVVGRFLAGKIILGKHKLSPHLSPNKTVEGYLGGIIFGTLLTVAFGQLLQLPIYATLLTGLLISTLSTVGDLGISLLKREARVKDSGRIFGEHGGALDRIDSLLWSVTLTYYLATLIF